MKTKYKNKEVAFCNDCREAVLICDDCQTKSCRNENCDKCKKIFKDFELVQHVYTNSFANKIGATKGERVESDLVSA